MPPNEFWSLDISVFISHIKYLGEALMRGHISLQFHIQFEILLINITYKYYYIKKGHTPKC